MVAHPNFKISCCPQPEKPRIAKLGGPSATHLVDGRAEAHRRESCSQGSTVGGGGAETQTQFLFFTELFSTIALVEADMKSSLCSNPYPGETYCPASSNLLIKLHPSAFMAVSRETWQGCTCSQLTHHGLFVPRTV